MRTNGTLKYRLFSDGSLTDDGIPVSKPIEESSPIPCFIEEVTNDLKRYEDGKYYNLSYKVLIERGMIPNNVTIVTLERHGVELGEYRIKGLPTITTLDRTIITV
jgi:hypothetical protein